MFCMKLQWKEFPINLNLIEKHFRAAHPSYVGSQAQSVFELYFSEDLPPELQLEISTWWDSLGADSIEATSYIDPATLKAEADALEAKRQRRLFGEKVIDKIGIINDSKGLTRENILAFMADPGVRAIDALLRSGSINTAKSSIQALDLATPALSIWNEADRAAVLAMMDASGYIIA